jgi:hypothetical protein
MMSFLSVKKRVLKDAMDKSVSPRHRGLYERQSFDATQFTEETSSKPFDDWIPDSEGTHHRCLRYRCLIVHHEKTS